MPSDNPFRQAHEATLGDHPWYICQVDDVWNMVNSRDRMTRTGRSQHGGANQTKWVIIASLAK